MTVVLRTEAAPGVPALLLRPWIDTDIAALVEVYTDPTLRRWTRFPVTSRQDAARWLRFRHDGWRDRDYLSFAVLEPARTVALPDGQPVDGQPGDARADDGQPFEARTGDGRVVDGRAGEPGTSRLVANVVLKRADPRGRFAEVGYWTAAYARGRGVAPRALEALTGWAFGTFAADGLERLELLHQVDNPASCRVAEKAGYGYERTLPARPPFPNDGHLHARHPR